MPVKMFGVQQFSQSEIYGVSTRYPTIGTVGYPVPTRTRSDKMYRVHHLPPESDVFCTAVLLYFHSIFSPLSLLKLVIITSSLDDHPMK